MRNDYIQAIRKIIAEEPRTGNWLDSAIRKASILEATREELEEAIQQELGQPNAPRFVTPPNPLDATIKKIVGIDALIHLVISVVVAGLILILPRTPAGSSLIGFAHDTLIPPSTKTINTVPKILPLEDNSSLAGRVYANAFPIDPATTFTAPVSPVTISNVVRPNREVIGFFPYWMLPVQDKISFNALTGIALFGLELDATGNIITNYPDGTTDGGWTMWQNPKLIDLVQRARNNKLKIILVAKSFNNYNIEQLSTSQEAQGRAIANISYLVNSKSLDGVNIDFEYLGSPTPEVRTGFSNFIANLNRELKKQNPNALISIDTYASSGLAPGLFDLPGLASNVDSFIIMGYDFHTPLSTAGPIAPMEGQMSILSCLAGFLDKVPADKITLGVPYYGYDWVVNSTGSPQPTGVIPYGSIANIIADANVQWDNTSQTPWYEYIDQTAKDTHHVYFESVRSLGIKYDFVNKKSLRGIAIWALGYEGGNNDLSRLILDKFSKELSYLW